MLKVLKVLASVDLVLSENLAVCLCLGTMPCHQLTEEAGLPLTTILPGEDLCTTLQQDELGSAQAWVPSCSLTREAKQRQHKHCRVNAHPSPGPS